MDSDCSMVTQRPQGSLRMSWKDGMDQAGSWQEAASTHRSGDSTIKKPLSLAWAGLERIAGAWTKSSSLSHC